MEVGTEFYLDLSKAAEISVEIPKTAESVVEKLETSDSAVVDKSETSESDAVDKTETAESEVNKLEIFKNGGHLPGTVASTLYSQGEGVEATTDDSEAIATDNFDHHSDINNALEASFVDNVDIMIQKNLHTLHPNVSETLFPSNNISSTLPTHENVSFPRTSSTGTVLSGSGDSELSITINTGDYSPSTIEPFGEMLPKTQYKERKRKRLKSFKSNSDSSQINSGEPSSLYVQALPLRQNDDDSLHNDRVNPVIESLVPRNGELSTVTSPFDGDSQEESYHPMVAHSRSRTNIYPDNSPPEAAGLPLNPPPESKHFSTTLRPSLARTTRMYGLSPGSLKPYSTKQSNNDKSARSVCHEDPCGAGVACHPVGTSFECVCSDDTKVEPNQPCPDIGTG
ncbi:unnamed protein product [Rotaria magnacalcarata]|uniref:Uncharacterized protein n=1 Tax=Rotaria magnacalcarata TaxID=392030 RepID=A0A816SN69_9BILA|nr:unnamed protein product [Rotaria magnacalcarata]CAF4161953.1 unnamed protein product [Rotaria magnacalcarata]